MEEKTIAIGMLGVMAIQAEETRTKKEKVTFLNGRSFIHEHSFTCLGLKFCYVCTNRF